MPVALDTPPAVIIPAPKELLKRSGSRLALTDKALLLMPLVTRRGGLTFVGKTAGSEITSTVSTYTHTALAISSAAANRQVTAVILARGQGSRTVNSVTIGGVTATIAVDAVNSQSNVTVVAAIVPSGTTADVVVAYDGTHARCYCAVFVGYGYSATKNASDSDISSANPLSTTVAIPNNGFVVGGTVTAGLDTDYTWVNITELVQGSWSGESYGMAGNSVITGSTPTITVGQGNLTQDALAVASYGAA